MVKEDWPTFVDKLKRYYAHSIEERRKILIVTLLFGFLYSMDKWLVGSEVHVDKFIIHFIGSTLAFFIAFYAHMAMQRVHALRLGYKPIFRMWMFGLLIAFFLGIVSGGKAWLILPMFGCVDIHMMFKHRVGHFRIGVSQLNMGLIGLVGPYTNLVIAYVAKILNIVFNSTFLNELIIINLAMAVWTILPIPPVSDGVRVMFWSRISYAFNFGVIISAALLIWFSNNFFYVFIGSILIGAIVWFIYYISFEEEAWSF